MDWKSFFTLIIYLIVKVNSSFTDWHLKSIGSPLPNSQLHNFIYISNSSTSDSSVRSIIYTVTDQNVLAALEPLTGDIVWRHKAPLHKLIRYESCAPGNLLVYSLNDVNIQLVSASTGITIWRNEYENPLLFAGCFYSELGLILTAQKDRIEAVDKDGSIKWVTYNDYSQVISVVKTNGTIGVIQLDVKKPSTTVLSFQWLNSTDGTLLRSSESLPVVGGTSDFKIVTNIHGNSVVIWLEAGVINSYDGSNFNILRSKTSAFISLLEIGLPSEPIFIGKKTDGTAIVVKVILEGLQQLWEFSDSNKEALYASHTDRFNNTYLGRLAFSNHLQLGSLQILPISSTSIYGKVLTMTGHTFPFSLKEFGSITAFALNVAPPTVNSSLASRIYLSTATASVQLWEGSFILWKREEGLSSIDTPPVFTLKQELKNTKLQKFVRQSIKDRVYSQYNSVLTTIQRQFSNSNILDTQTSIPLNLVIISSSKFFTLYALNVDTFGSLMWKVTIPLEDRADFEIWSSLLIHYNQNTAFEVAAKSLTKNGTFITYMLDYSTGTLRNRQVKIEKKSNGIIRNGNTLASHGHNQSIIWKLIVPKQERILDIVEKDLIASTGRHLGKRSTLIKYLNPHLFIVATLNSVTSLVSIHIIDSNSGLIVYFEVVKNVNAESFKLHYKDNWLVYSFVDSISPHSLRIISTELYSLTSKSSLSASTLEVVSRSFNVFNEIFLLGVTKTTHGITSYGTIFISFSGQLIAIPRSYIDARRQFKNALPYDKDISGLPYISYIALDDSWIQTSGKKLVGIEQLVTTSGYFESESIILAYGLDLFCTRLSPSQSFDLLPPSFNKIQLVITLSILITALMVLRVIANKRKLQENWYNL